MPALFRPSIATPLTIEASPTRQTTRRPFGLFVGSNASALSESPRAIPTPVLIAVPACPTENRSYDDSAGRGTRPCRARCAARAGRDRSAVCGGSTGDRRRTAGDRARKVEDIVQRDGQFDDAEVGGEVPAGLRHLFDDARRISAARAGNCSIGSRLRSAGERIVSSRLVISSAWPSLRWAVLREV